MRHYRLYEDSPQRSALGFGPGGGRWNHPGAHIIYFSNFTSVAINEILSIKGTLVSRSNWKLATLEVKDTCFLLDEAILPRDWNKRPIPISTRNIGSRWVKEMEGVCLKVPSARLNLSAFPGEHNLLVNPFHPDFSKHISVLATEDFRFQIGAGKH